MSCAPLFSRLTAEQEQGSRDIANELLRSDSGQEGRGAPFELRMLVLNVHTYKPLANAAVDEADREKLLAVQASEAGINYVLCQATFGDLPLNASLRIVEMFRSKILPYCSAPALVKAVDPQLLACI